VYKRQEYKEEETPRTVRSCAAVTICGDAISSSFRTLLG